MARGYAEGPASEELLTVDEDQSALGARHRLTRAVYGSTSDDPTRHFLGWLGEVDPDDLFARGEAWGLSIVEREQ